MSNITFQCRPVTQEEHEQIAQQLRAHSEIALGRTVSSELFGLVAYEEDRLIGSVVGKIFLGWLHIDLFWVTDTHRGKGLGTHLMALTQEIAMQQQLDGIEVWTQSWQAPEFYHKLGYEEFAAIDDFLPFGKRHAFRRYLNAEARHTSSMAIDYPPPPLAGSDALPFCDMIRKHIDTYYKSHGESLPSPGVYNRLMALVEKPLIESTLAATKGNQIKAATILGLNRNTLRKKITDLEIDLSQF